MTPEEILISRISSFKSDPYSFVKFSFPWGEGVLEKEKIEEWQKEILLKFRDGLSINKALQIAISSGHGIGKSALVSWLILWSLATKSDTRGVVTANTENQLKQKTWAELSKWYNLFIAKHWFEFTATSIFSKDKKHERTWRFDLVPWSIEKTEAFAGLHNKGKRIVLIFDEASAIVDKIWEVSEGALTDKDTEIIWAVFGNPTRNDGRFKDCFFKNKHRWITNQIDSRKVKITNKDQINKWVEDYGEDSDFVRVRVRGVFPNASSQQFIPQSLVEESRVRTFSTPLQYNFAPKIIGIDPAWSGGDETTIFFRQGNFSKILATYPRNDNDFEIANYLAKFEDDEKADCVFIDQGMGTGIYSAGLTMQRRWILVPFGGKSADNHYKNKRAEMWGLMRKWLQEGGVIPDDPVLCQELVGPEYFINVKSDQLQLESKEDMKIRGVPSPNRADALALTFAQPVYVNKTNNSNNNWKNGSYIPKTYFSTAN